MQRGLAALEIDNHGLDARLGERIEALLEELLVVGNGVLKLVALIAHAAPLDFVGGSRALSVIAIGRGGTMIRR
jgi:hypothetical protein